MYSKNGEAEPVKEVLSMASDKNPTSQAARIETKKHHCFNPSFSRFRKRHAIAH